MRSRAFITLVVFVAGTLVGAVEAAETDWWVVDTTADLLAGEGDGVAVLPEGRLRGMPSWQSAVTFDEPVVLASDQLPNGDLVVATGHPARLYRVRRNSAELLAELPGEQATAVRVTADGSVWVATVAPGVLLRWRPKVGIEEVGRLDEGGFWDLVELDGVLIAAAGPPAALFEVRNGKLHRWVELPDAFARSMVVKDAGVVVGTSGKGLVVRVDSQGRVLLIADSPFTEISDIVVGPGGQLYATALVGEPVSQSTATASQADASSNENGGGVQTESLVGLDLDLPKINGKTATSEVFRLSDEGAILSIRRFPKQVASALAATEDGVLVGTGYEGEVWLFNDDGGARLATIDAVQVMTFSRDGASLLTQGPAAVFRRTGNDERPHRFRSDSKKYPRPVRFGEYRLYPADSGARIRFRTGGTSGPDPLWLPWTEFSEGTVGTVEIEFGKALQWEVELPSEGRLDRVEVASREVNLAPVVQSVTVEDPGVVYLMSPPPSGPVIRNDHPTFEGIFTTMGAGDVQNSQGGKGKKFFQVGYRTVAWNASDGNGDPLLFDLQLENARGFVLPVRERLSDDQLAVDTTAVPDGRYRFRLTASDGEANPGPGLRDEKRSEWFRVDNLAPEVAAERSGADWIITVRDASPLVKVEASRNGERWQALEPEDGLLDGAVERFVFPATEEPGLVVFRAFDRHHNSSSTGVEE